MGDRTCSSSCCSWTTGRGVWTKADGRTTHRGADAQSRDRVPPRRSRAGQEQTRTLLVSIALDVPPRLIDLEGERFRVVVLREGGKLPRHRSPKLRQSVVLVAHKPALSFPLPVRIAEAPCLSSGVVDIFEKSDHERLDPVLPVGGRVGSRFLLQPRRGWREVPQSTKEPNPGSAPPMPHWIATIRPRPTEPEAAGPDQPLESPRNREHADPVCPAFDAPAAKHEGHYESSDHQADDSSDSSTPSGHQIFLVPNSRSRPGQFNVPESRPF